MRTAGEQGVEGKEDEVQKGVTMALLIAAGLLAAACGSTRGAASVDPGTAVVSGLIWLDVCDPTAENAIPDGCVPCPAGQTIGNGTADPLDPIASSAWLVLWSGACPGELAYAARASEQDGTYEFTGLPAGSYCLVIDPTVGDNVRVLGAGTWTLPAGLGSGPVILPIDLAPAEERRGVNFAYDPSEVTGP